MNKKVGVLFSGGLDSTYLIWKNLKEGNEVYPIYIEIGNNIYKSILEKNRIDLLYRKFEEEFDVNGEFDYQTRIHRADYGLKVDVNSHGDGLMFKQMPIWLFGMVFQCGNKLDEIQIGYVMNDDAISYINDIQKIYKSYQSISDKLIPLKFPLVKTSKYQMAAELPPQYFELVVSCENPRIVGSEEAPIVEYEPCCECDACKKIIATKYYGRGSFPKYYENAILDKYARELHWKGFKILDNEGNDYMDKFTMNERNEPRQLEIPFECDVDVVDVEQYKEEL